MRGRETWEKLQKISINVWAQSMRGLPTTLFLPVFVNRGHSSVSGSKTTRRSGSFCGRRRTWPNQRSWDRRIWTLKRVALQRLRICTNIQNSAPSHDYFHNYVLFCERVADILKIAKATFWDDLRTVLWNSRNSESPAFVSQTPTLKMIQPKTSIGKIPKCRGFKGNRWWYASQRSRSTDCEP